MKEKPERLALVPSGGPIDLVVEEAARFVFDRMQDRAEEITDPNALLESLKVIDEKAKQLALKVKKSERAKRWYQKHQEEARSASLAWRKDNPEKVKANKARERIDKEKAKARHLKWRQANREKLRAASRNIPKDRSREYGRKYREANKEKNREQAKERCRKYREKKRLEKLAAEGKKP